MSKNKDEDVLVTAFEREWAQMHKSAHVFDGCEAVIASFNSSTDEEKKEAINDEMAAEAQLNGHWPPLRTSTSADETEIIATSVVNQYLDSADEEDLISEEKEAQLTYDQEQHLKKHRCWNCYAVTPYHYCEDCSSAIEAQCPHNNRPGDCVHCDVSADLAFDSDRERGN